MEQQEQDSEEITLWWTVLSFSTTWISRAESVTQKQQRCKAHGDSERCLRTRAVVPRPPLSRISQQPSQGRPPEVAPRALEALKNTEPDREMPVCLCGTSTWGRRIENGIVRASCSQKIRHEFYCFSALCYSSPRRC